MRFICVITAYLHRCVNRTGILLHYSHELRCENLKQNLMLVRKRSVAVASQVVWGMPHDFSVALSKSLEGDSMERYPERCFHIIAPGQPKFDFNTSSISPLYETSYKTFIFNYKQIKIMSMPQ